MQVLNGGADQLFLFVTRGNDDAERHGCWRRITRGGARQPSSGARISIVSDSQSRIQAGGGRRPRSRKVGYSTRQRRNPVGPARCSVCGPWPAMAHPTGGIPPLCSARGPNRSVALSVAQLGQRTSQPRHATADVPGARPLPAPAESGARQRRARSAGCMRVSTLATRSVEAQMRQWSARSRHARTQNERKIPLFRLFRNWRGAGQHATPIDDDREPERMSVFDGHDFRTPPALRCAMQGYRSCGQKNLPAIPAGGDRTGRPGRRIDREP